MGLPKTNQIIESKKEKITEIIKLETTILHKQIKIQELKFQYYKQKIKTPTQVIVLSNTLILHFSFFLPHLGFINL